MSVAVAPHGVAPHAPVNRLTSHRERRAYFRSASPRRATPTTVATIAAAIAAIATVRALPPVAVAAPYAQAGRWGAATRVTVRVDRRMRRMAIRTVHTAVRPTTHALAPRIPAPRIPPAPCVASTSTSPAAETMYFISPVFISVRDVPVVEVDIVVGGISVVVALSSPILRRRSVAVAPPTPATPATIDLGRVLLIVGTVRRIQRGRLGGRRRAVIQTVIQTVVREPSVQV